MKKKTKEIIEMLKLLGTIEEIDDNNTEQFGPYLFLWGGKEQEGIDSRFNVKGFPCIISFNENKEIKLKTFVLFDGICDKEKVTNMVNEINADCSHIKVYIDDDNDVNIEATVPIEKSKMLESMIMLMMLCYIKLFLAGRCDEKE